MATPYWQVHYEPEIGVDELQIGAESVPACTSLGCKTDTAAKEPDPPKGLSQINSRPACNTDEGCKTGTAAPKVATPYWQVHYEPEIGVDEL